MDVRFFLSMPCLFRIKFYFAPFLGMKSTVDVEVEGDYEQDA